MSDDYVLGSECALYIGADTASPVVNSLTIVEEARDVTLDPTMSEIDCTTRANSGFKSTGTGLKDLSIDGELLFQPGNTNYATLRNAFLGTGKISAACLTDARDAENAEGPYGRWSITKLTQPQPLDGALVCQFTLKLFKYTGWHGVASQS
jgi:hypothetical protein